MIPYRIRRWFNGDAWAARRYRKAVGLNDPIEVRRERARRLSDGAPRRKPGDADA